MHRFKARSCSAVLLVGLATATRASEVQELEALLRRVEVGIVQDDEVVAWLRAPRDDSQLSAALRAAIDARTPSSPRRAATALAALVVVDPVAARDALARALEHPSSEVRVAALALLGEVEPREPEAPVRVALLDALARRPRREAALAIEALATWGEPGTCILPILEAVERDSTHTSVALRALTRIVGTDAGDLSAWWRLWAASASLWPEHQVLLAVVDGGDPTAVVAALEKLGRLPHPQTFATIERFVRRRNAEGRWDDPVIEEQGIAVARALGALRDPRGQPALQELLDAARAPEGLLASARLALVRLRGGVRPAVRSQDDASLVPLEPGTLPTSGGSVEQAPGSAGPDVVCYESRVAAVAWAVAAAALATAALSALARRSQRSTQPRSALTADAARLVARALQEIEVESGLSLRKAPEPFGSTTHGPQDGSASRRPQSGSASHEPQSALASHEPPAPEASDDVVHVVLGSPPSVQDRCTRGDADVAWQSAMAGVDELDGNVGRVVARVNGADEQVVYEAGDDVSLADAMATPPPPRSVPAEEVDEAWAGLLDALQSMDGSVSELSARLRCPQGSPLRALYPSPDVPTFAAAITALEGLEPLVAEVRVRLAGVTSDLVLLDRDAAPIVAAPVVRSAPVESADWVELVRAVEEIASEVEAVVVRGTDGETVVLRGDDEGGLPELLASLRALEGTAAHVRVRLAREGGELVLLDQPASGPPASVTPPMRTSITWRHVLGSIEAMGEALDAISAKVVGADRRLLFGPGAPLSLAQALSELGGGADAFQDVKVRLKHSASELTLFDRALAS